MVDVEDRERICSRLECGHGKASPTVTVGVRFDGDHQPGISSKCGFRSADVLSKRRQGYVSPVSRL